MGLSCDPPLLFQFYVLLLIIFTKFTFDKYQMLYYYLYQHLIISDNAFLIQIFFPFYSYTKMSWMYETKIE